VEFLVLSFPEWESTVTLLVFVLSTVLVSVDTFFCVPVFVIVSVEFTCSVPLLTDLSESEASEELNP
jgi:hypothetical protein